MTRFYTLKSGKKQVKGQKYDKVVGSRAQVWHGTAHHTKGALAKKDLMMNKRGRIVSRRKSASAKREKRLIKAGYKTKKGHFGFIKVSSMRTSKRGSRSRRRNRTYKGGNGVNYALSPSKFDGEGVGTSGVDLQFVAGQSG